MHVLSLLKVPSRQSELHAVPFQMNPTAHYPQSDPLLHSKQLSRQGEH